VVTQLGSVFILNLLTGVLTKYVDKIVVKTFYFKVIIG